MTTPETYRVILHPGLDAQFDALKHAADHDPGGPEARLLLQAIAALEVLRDGKEGESRGERLGYSPSHADLRDCAEIKVPVVAEYTRDGKPRGPSHRMVYREFEGTAEDPRPVREILSFEHRKNGRPFTVAAARLGRSKSIRLLALDHLGNVTPAVGRRKDANRPTGPVRLPLPPDLAAALATPPARSPTGRPARALVALRRGPPTVGPRPHHGAGR